MKYIFPPAKIPSLAIAGTDALFPVHRIYCVGRNYSEHAVEMGGDGREAPFFFSKPSDSIVCCIPSVNAKIPYPLSTQNLHHEIELVVAIGRDGVKIPQTSALDHVFGYAVGVDLTRRDMQQEAKERRGPWDSAKGFDDSAPIGLVYPVTDVGHPSKAHIWLDVNGEKRQSGDIQSMTWSVTEVVSILSHQFHLRPGDLIYTGTPKGVGAIVSGDKVTGGVDGVDDIAFTIE